MYALISYNGFQPVYYYVFMKLIYHCAFTKLIYDLDKKIMEREKKVLYTGSDTTC